jgi:hypothetical protein
MMKLYSEKIGIIVLSIFSGHLFRNTVAERLNCIPASGLWRDVGALIFTLTSDGEVRAWPIARWDRPGVAGCPARGHIITIYLIIGHGFWYTV